ncbi:hypothetical protein ABIB10_006839 [Bradyrhizobium sp. RT3b]
MYVQNPIWVLGASVVALTVSYGTSAVAAPSADAARKCMRFSYLAYPYKRPGSAPGTADRQTYFKECMGKDGNVPEPAHPASSPKSDG